MDQGINREHPYEYGPDNQFSEPVHLADESIQNDGDSQEEYHHMTNGSERMPSMRH
jgi:hypothetical protein